MPEYYSRILWGMHALSKFSSRSAHGLHLCAGDLTSEQVTSLVDARTFIRLKELLDGLSTIGLLKPSLVLTDSSGQSAGLKEARWAAETASMLEEPPAEAPERQGFWGGERHYPVHRRTQSWSGCLWAKADRMA